MPDEASEEAKQRNASKEAKREAELERGGDCNVERTSWRVDHRRGSVDCFLKRFIRGCLRQKIIRFVSVPNSVYHREPDRSYAETFETLTNSRPPSGRDLSVLLAKDIFYYTYSTM